MKQISIKLEYLRRNKGWTQENVAAEIGISQSSYVRLIKNPESISLSRLTQLAKLYQITVSELTKDAADTYFTEEMENTEISNASEIAIESQNDGTPMNV